MPPQARRLSPPGEHRQTGMCELPRAGRPGLRPECPRPTGPPRATRRLPSAPPATRVRTKCSTRNRWISARTYPTTCGMCHDKVAGDYKGSVHGKAISRGEMSAAVCTDCHGEHRILSKNNEASPVHGVHLRETCGQCHGNVALARRFGMPADRLTTFDSSFHGLAAKGGNQTVANCASCHGIHNILPSADPQAMTNTKNLPATCGKCHPGAGQRFALGPVHQSEGKNEPKGMDWIRAFYLTAIPFHAGADDPAPCRRPDPQSCGATSTACRCGTRRPTRASCGCCPSSACPTRCWRCRSSSWPTAAWH